MVPIEGLGGLVVKPGDICITWSEAAYEVKHFKSKIISSLKVPSEYLGLRDVSNGDTLCTLIECTSKFYENEQWTILIEGKISTRYRDELTLFVEANSEIQ